MKVLKQLWVTFKLGAHNAQIRLFAAVLMLFAQPAHAAKLSELFSGMSTEVAAGVKLALLCIAAVGIVTAGVAILTWISASRRNEPAKWQLWGVLGGALATVIPAIVLATAGSLSDESGGTQSMFQELNIGY